MPASSTMALWGGVGQQYVLFCSKIDLNELKKMVDVNFTRMHCGRTSFNKQQTDVC